MKYALTITAFLLLAMSVHADPAPVFLYIEFFEPDQDPTGGNVAGGCAVEPGQACNGLFYFDREGSGIFMGTIINERPNPEFELLFSAQVEPTESGQDLVVVTYAMAYSEDGNVVDGKRASYRESVRFGDKVEIPIDDMFADDPFSLIITVGSRSDLPWGQGPTRTYQLEVISTNVGPAESSSRRTTHRRELRPRMSFSSDFRDIDQDQNQHKSLRYNVQAYLEGWDPGTPPVGDYKLHYKRQYLIDSTAAGENRSYQVSARFQSVYTRDLQLSPDKVIKIVFPPDEPSVHGFDIEDTLIISLPPSESQ